MRPAGCPRRPDPERRRPSSVAQYGYVVALIMMFAAGCRSWLSRSAAFFDDNGGSEIRSQATRAALRLRIQAR